MVLTLLMLGSIGLQLAVPLLLSRFIDAAIAREAVSGMVAIGVAYLVAGIVNQVLDAGASYLGADIGWRATNRLREELGEHLLTLDMGFHNDTTPGEMIERVDGDVTAISDFISRFLVRLVGAGVLLIGVLVVCWFEDYRMGIAITIYVLAVLVAAGEPAEAWRSGRRGGAGGLGPPVRIHRRAARRDRGHPVAGGGALHHGPVRPGHAGLLRAGPPPPGASGSSCGSPPTPPSGPGTPSRWQSGPG